MFSAEEIEKKLFEIEENGKSRIDNFLDEYFEQEKIRIEKIEKMMSNTDYIKWLEKFTREHNSFDDDSWLYCPDKISTDDKENVDKLNLFYKGIENFAEKNCIYPIPCDFGGYYKIRLGTVGFIIGKIEGQGIVCGCKRVKIDNILEFIDFDDIMNNKKIKNTDKIKKQLKRLSKSIKKCHDNGIPLEAIVEMVENTIEKLEDNEENDKTKTFSKKKKKDSYEFK